MSTTNRFAVLIGAAALACVAWAQPPPDQYQSQESSPDVSAQQPGQVDPPKRVARLAYLSGEVSFAPSGESDWSRAQTNRPMVTGDRLYTTNGRAELQVGATSIQVDQQTSFDFLNLDDQTAQMELTQGAMNLDVRRLRSGEVYEVDTPTIAFIADRAGDYRVDVDPRGQATTVSVRRGSGEAVGEGGKRVRIEEGQSVVFNDSQLSDYKTVQMRTRDNFDSFAEERDARYEHSPSRSYVNEDVTGYADLDDNGTWEDAPEYGHVWYPSGVAVDWAPYHDGNWDWVEPYGWTWVDAQPWGYAPFHYGRWAYIDSRWGWVPGPIDVEPVYAPALVAFVGGGGFGIDISLGGPIGWFALGPGDVYFPGYPCGHSYFNSVNISNTVVNNTVINNYYGAFSSGRVNYAQINYANRTAPRAMTAMSATAFASGRPVASSAIAVNRTTLANARVLPRATVAPTRASLVANRGRATPPPATVLNRTVIAATRPAPAPAPFAQRQALLRQNPGRPLNATQMRSVATTRANNPGLTRSNVRVAGTMGAAANANARATANAANQPPGSRGATNFQRGAANAQLRSSGFAHGGKPTNVPRESATAQAHASPNARFERGTSRPVTPPRESATAQAHASSNARFERGATNANAPMRSSGFAHAGKSTNVPRESATAQTHASANARFERGSAHPVATPHESATAQTHASAKARFERGTSAAPVRSSSFATRNRAANTEQRNLARTVRPTESHVQTPYRAPSTTRMTAPSRAQAQSYRPAERPATRVMEQPRAQAQYRAPERSTMAPPRAQAQQYRPQRPAARVMEPPRAQAQSHEAPRPTSTREPAPQRQAKAKNEKRDQGGGYR